MASLSLLADIDLWLSVCCIFVFVRFQRHFPKYEYERYPGHGKLAGRQWSEIQCLLYFCLCLIPCWFDFAGYGKVTNKPLPPNMNTKEISRSWFTYKLVVLQWIWIWKRYPGHGKLYLADIDPWFSGGHGPRQVMHPTVSQQTHQKYKYKCKKTKKPIQIQKHEKHK